MDSKHPELSEIKSAAITQFKAGILRNHRKPADIFAYLHSYLKTLHTLSPLMRCVLLTGLLLLSLQTFSQDNNDSFEKSIVFTKAQVMPSFPGGDTAWKSYITNAFKKTDLTFSAIDEGICRVRFIVDKDGSISDVRALTMRGTLLAKFAEEVIAAGPRWVPAKQNNYIVRCYQEQPIVLTLTK